MGRAYFIGGAPRVCKSTLALKFQERQSLICASTDSLRETLRATTSPAHQPDLFYLDSLNSDEPNMAHLMQYRTADIIAAADRESEAVWPAVEAFVSKHIDTNRDVLVEGVAILPHLITTLAVDYSVIYLGNQSPSQSQVIKEFAATHPDTWLGTLHPQTVAAFAHFCQSYSLHQKKQAAKFKQPYLEMSAHPFPEALQLALTKLMPIK